MDARNGGLGRPEGPAERDVVEAAGGAGVRVSDRERDAVVQRVQAAFAEGRLDDTEFDERMRAALTSRTRGDLDVLLTDLPAETAAPGAAPAAAGRGPGRVAIALKSSVRRGGRWRVPEPVHDGRLQGQRLAGPAGRRAQRASRPRSWRWPTNPG